MLPGDRSGALAALGFAPHSGWAAMIGIAGGDARLRLLVRERLEMADPHEPGSKQPYHAVEGLPIGEAQRRLAAYAATSERMAHESIRRVVDELAEGAHRVIGVGILESAGRKGSSLAATLASHALIHTADGDHFRTAVAAGATRCRLATLRVGARDLEAEAAAVIGRTPDMLHRTLKELGREVGPPWGADQKAAALLAWLVLAAHEGREVRRQHGDSDRQTR